MYILAAEADAPHVSVEELKAAYEQYDKPRSAFDKGVKLYALDILDDVQELVDYEKLPGVPKDVKKFKELALNGAGDWKEYSWGGSSLVYDEDIAERLCSPSELKRNKNGELPPNGKEEWLDVQGRALDRAFRRLCDTIRFGMR